MRKAIICFMTAMMVLSLAACTPTSEKGKTGEVKQTEATNGVSDKQPDPTAPKLDIVSVYSVGEGGGKLEGTMDSLEALTPQALVDLLIQYGVLDEGTTSISFETEGTVEEEGVGPDFVKIPGMEPQKETTSENGILNLSKAPSGSDQEMKLQAVANTFIENMKVMQLTIQVDGEPVASGLGFMEAGK